MNSQDINLLSQIYKSANIGTNTIKSMIPDVADTNIKQELQSQMINYKSVKESAENQLLGLGIAPKEQNVITKALNGMSVKINTMADTSPSHISEMMIEETTTGIIDIKKAINQNPQADSGIKQQADDLIAFKQNSIETFKQFL